MLPIVPFQRVMGLINAVTGVMVRHLSSNSNYQALTRSDALQSRLRSVVVSWIDKLESHLYDNIPFSDWQRKSSYFLSDSICKS